MKLEWNKWKKLKNKKTKNKKVVSTELQLPTTLSPANQIPCSGSIVGFCNMRPHVGRGQTRNGQIDFTVLPCFYSCCERCIRATGWHHHVFNGFNSCYVSRVYGLFKAVGTSRDVTKFPVKEPRSTMNQLFLPQYFCCHHVLFSFCFFHVFTDCFLLYLKFTWLLWLF